MALPSLVSQVRLLKVIGGNANGSHPVCPASSAGVTILALRGLWLSQDNRWTHSRENRCAYVN